VIIMHHIKAIITKQNGKQSTGRGFSPSELEKAGVNKQQAKQMGLPVDVKRKSAHDENVATIKAHAEKAKAQAEAKPKPQKTEPTSKKKAKS
jgi:ribosomal protein L13E